MALLSFPASPTNGQLYPTSPLRGQNQYEWAAAEQTWRLLGPATGVAPGCYGDSVNISTFCVDAQGRITSAAAIPPDLVKTNNPSAYNSYVWPSFDGTASQVLQTDGAGNLTWGTPDASNITVTPSINGLTNLQAILQNAIYDVSSTNAGISVTETPVGQVALTLNYATPAIVGGVKVDNDTITINPSGVIKANLRYVYYDDISSSFDGIAKAFSLRVGGVPTAPVPSTNILVVLGGVPQNPGLLNSYTVSGSTITFNSAPLAGSTFMATTIA